MCDITRKKKSHVNIDKKRLPLCLPSVYLLPFPKPLIAPIVASGRVAGSDYFLSGNHQGRLQAPTVFL